VDRKTVSLRGSSQVDVDDFVAERAFGNLRLQEPATVGRNGFVFKPLEVTKLSRIPQGPEPVSGPGAILRVSTRFSAKVLNRLIVF
jgi:hypothetical protein